MEIKVGVIGVGRGMSFADGAELCNMKLVALCDKWEEKLNQFGKDKDISLYTDYDEFLKHDMDAVILANYFDEHTPFAIKALKAGKHVLSETTSNITLAEGVELCRTVEATGKIYMLAENYPYTKFNLEIQKIYSSGELGRVLYAEGEYNHPLSPEYAYEISPGRNHWRNNLPSTYYCTHALAPLMHITGATPIRVNGISIAFEEFHRTAIPRGDRGSVIICQMDNGAVFKLLGIAMPGHSNWYRLHGSKGAAEITRGPGYFGPEQVRVWHDEWDLEEGMFADRVYSPNWPDKGELADKAGHGGGDFWIEYYFAKAITENKQPFFDVYKAVTMANVGILSWKSALENGTPFDIPDFTNEKVRQKYENDHWNPLSREAGSPPTSIINQVEPDKEAVEYAKKIWRKNGYFGE